MVLVRIRYVTVGIRFATRSDLTSTAYRGGDMTAAIARTAGRAAAANRMTPARPDQLPPVPPALAGSAAGTAARLSGVRKPSRGPILVVTTGIAAAF